MNATVHDCEQDSAWVKDEAKRAFLGAEKKSSISRMMSVYTVSQLSYAVYPDYQKKAHHTFSCDRVRAVPEIILRGAHCFFGPLHPRHT